MSIRIMTAVWDHGPTDRSALLVLLAIADHANDDGIAWPSELRLARKARLGGWLTDDMSAEEKDRMRRNNRRTVRRVIRRLEADGFLEVESTGSGRTASVYRVDLVRLDLDPAPIGYPQRTAQSAKRGDRGVPPGGAGESPQGGPGGPPQSSATTIKEPTAEVVEAVDNIPADPDAIRSALAEAKRHLGHQDFET